jgi:hypothetical protein
MRVRMPDVIGCEISQRAVSQATDITFAQVRALAEREGLTPENLATRFRGQIERPSEVFGRVRDMRLGDVVIPYTAVIEWYQRLSGRRPALNEERACHCGCGVLVLGKRKCASSRCRKRVQRWGGGEKVTEQLETASLRHEKSIA